MTLRKVLLISFIFMLLGSGCGIDKFTKESSEKFADQHFKTSISLIELYKVRNGEYPESLEAIKYIGEWDQMIFTSVEYKKLESGGYELNLNEYSPFNTEINLVYPSQFWEGLGLKKSNIK